MTSLTGDIVNRVRRLPKPTSAAEALQPLFEAISNAMHAIEDRFGPRSAELGRIDVTIVPSSEGPPAEIIIVDNGIGLDDERFSAFLTTDTAFKIGRGGKGVGRLLWLDAFDSVRVQSDFEQDGTVMRRSFDFVLDRTDQVRNENLEDISPSRAAIGTRVVFRGIRGSTYGPRFPVQPAVIVRHFGSHFLAEFILARSPRIQLSIGEHSADFPEAIEQLLLENRGRSTSTSDAFGSLGVTHFIFKPAASAGFDGNHQLHLIANGRTVVTRKIDGLLGVGRLGNQNGVYHGCVSGEFLDERVNQERTHFNFDESIADDIVKVCAQVAMAEALSTEIIEYDAARLETLNEFLAEYPSFGFATPEDLLKTAPKNATKPEQFAQALIPTRIRRDEDRNRRVQEIVTAMGEGHEVSGDFAELIRQAADDVRAEEQRQLTEYVLRRRIVLDVLDVLIRRLRVTEAAEDTNYIESTLHQFICPMRVRGDDPIRAESTDHDLWVIDERLAFASYFASDVPISQLVVDSASGERPDVLIWDRLHGLGFDVDGPLERVLLVEFKKPGRTAYDDRYSPQNQIARYLEALSNGEVESFRRERVRIAPDCVFYCYVIADIVGTLDTYTRMWRTTADGRGRWMELSGNYRGTIELIEWRDLIDDARARNRAFIELAR